jgi:hypothetical protein
VDPINEILQKLKDSGFEVEAQNHDGEFKIGILPSSETKGGLFTVEELKSLRNQDPIEGIDLDTIAAERNSGR